MVLGEILAGDPFDLDAVFQRALAFLAQVLALVGREAGEEVLERAVPVVHPVELLVHALEPAGAARQRPFRFGLEGDVD